MILDGKNIPLRIERSKRKSVSLQISDTAELVVKAPVRTTQEQLESFVTKHKDWVFDKIQKRSDSNLLNADYLNGRRMLLLGQAYDIAFGPVKSVSINGNTVLLPLKNSGLPKPEIDRALAKWLRKAALELTKNVADDLSARLCLPYESLRLSNARTRWGSCDAKKRISFNFRIACLPRALIEYIVLHELCHTVQLNHSPAFWACVAKTLPQYKVLRNQLKNYGWLQRLFR